VLLPTGAGEPKTFPRDSLDHSRFFGAFVPDGKSIVFEANEPGRPSRLFFQDLAGGPARPIGAEGVTGIVLSPDGESVVTGSLEQGFSIVPLRGGSARPIPGLEPKEGPLQWTADGRFLFVGSMERELPARVFRLEVATGKREPWKELMPADPAGFSLLRPAQVSSDGKTILFIFGQSLAELYVAEGLK
jgi:hypothetical protein